MIYSNNNKGSHLKNRNLYSHTSLVVQKSQKFENTDNTVFN